jgi:uncharacterized glyoxalase superfamily protein PhnB
MANVRAEFNAQGNRWYIATTFVPLDTIASDLHTVTCYFHPIGAQRFIDFVTNAFGGKELMRHAEGDMIMHAKVQIGSSVIELGEARFPSQPLPTAIYLYVDDVDAMYEQALKAGGVSMLAPTMGLRRSQRMGKIALIMFGIWRPPSEQAKLCWDRTCWDRASPAE